MNSQEPKPKLAQIIAANTNDESIFIKVFKPSPEFYKVVGINRKRFGQLCRGEKKPISDELVALANYFKINIQDLI